MSNYVKSLVSVISPCYNGAEYLPVFLDSVLEQTYPYVELIIVNDCSTDNSEEVIESYKDRFVERGYTLISINQSRNSGQAAAINRGLPLFTGEYVFWMDSDDILMPTNIEEKVAMLENDSSIDFVLVDGYIVNENDPDVILGELRRVPPAGKDTLFQDLIYGLNVVFCPATIMARSKALIEVIPSKHIYESRQGQNWQLMLPLAAQYKCGYIQKPLFKYVIHSNSHSHQKRNYQQWIERQDESCRIMMKTIETIPQMSNNSKEEWLHTIEVFGCTKKLEYSMQWCKWGDSIVYRKELKRLGYHCPFRLNPIVFYVSWIYSRLKRKVFKITS